MSRIDQVDSVLSRELAAVIPHYVSLKGGLITVVDVSCTPDLRWANVKVSILPEKYAGTVLAQLRKHSGQFSAALRKRIKMRRLPTFNWLNDITESKAAELDEVFKEIARIDEETTHNDN